MKDVYQFLGKMKMHGGYYCAITLKSAETSLFYPNLDNALVHYFFDRSDGIQTPSSSRFEDRIPPAKPISSPSLSPADVTKNL